MRLIDADALEKRLDNEKWMDNYDRDFIVDAALDEAPTADAVPVVRCKDCKHNESCFINEMIIAETKQDNPYCSAGAKMEDRQ